MIQNLRTRFQSISPAIAILLLAASSALAADKSSEMDAVLAANGKFYAALNAMFEGDPKPFEEVWWHTDDVVYMGADGAYNVGWKMIYENWKKQAKIKIGGNVEAEDVRVFVSGDMAMTSQYTVGVNRFDGKDVPIKLRSTSVFLKKDGEWRMVRHHVDVINDLRKSLGE